MAAFLHEVTVDLKSRPKAFYLGAVLYEGDALADRIAITVLDGGEPASLSGTVAGKVILSNGSTVAVTGGSISDNVVSIALPAAVYTVTGAIKITVSLTTGSVVTTLFGGVAIVTESTTDTIIDPGTVMSSIDSLIAAIDAAVDSIPDDYSALMRSREFFEKGKELQLTWNYGYISCSDLSITDSGSTHVYSDCIQIPANTMLYMPRTNKSTSVTMLALCDYTGIPTKVLMQGCSTSNSTGEYILYPIFEDTYVRFGGNMSLPDYMHFYSGAIDKDFCFDTNSYSKFNNAGSMTYVTDSAIYSSGVNASTGMIRSDEICLPKGMTIEFWGCACGESDVATLSETQTVGGGVTQVIVAGTNLIQHQTYTAPDHMYVRLSARIAPNSSAFNVVLPEAMFKAWKVYYKPTHITDEIKASPLYQKNLTVMGDSLIYGNKLGTEATWANNIAIKYDMDVTNLGVNANPVARVDGVTGMVDRLASIPATTDYFVMDGGANDRTSNVPIGEIDSTDVTTFCGALNTIISTFRATCPKAHFVLLTNYQRYTAANDLGLTDVDYVNAMLRVASRQCVPVFDNWHQLGITFLDSNQIEWMDEAKNRQKLVDDVVTYYDNVKHFSIEAYAWLTPIYEQMLLNNTAATNTSIATIENNTLVITV